MKDCKSGKKNYYHSMQKNAFHYIEYSFSKLFSKQFWNIIGSSLIVSFVMTLIISLWLIGWWYYIYMQTPVSTFWDDIWLYGISSALISILLLSLLALLVRGWLAIIIPIRSIDPTENLDFIGDWNLYKNHIGRYFAYIFWYSLIFLGLIASYPFLLILTSALNKYFGLLYGIVGIIMMLYMMTRMYFAWYHMLSEQSGSMKTFFVAQKLTKGKVWKIFWKVLLYSMIIWIGACLIESIMNILLSLVGGWHLANTIAESIQVNKENVGKMWGDIRILFRENPDKMVLIPIIFWIFYSASSVLSSAMFHIFYVRYYLDIREEYDMESSFIRPMLKRSEHHHSHQ